MENKVPNEISIHRWSKWIDGNGKLWIVTALGGYYKRSSSPKSTLVELLDTDLEQVQDYPIERVQAWIRKGALKRVEGPILI